MKELRKLLYLKKTFFFSFLLFFLLLLLCNIFVRIYEGDFSDIFTEHHSVLRTCTKRIKIYSCLEFFVVKGEQNNVSYLYFTKFKTKSFFWLRKREYRTLEYFLFKGCSKSLHNNPSTNKR